MKRVLLKLSGKLSPGRKKDRIDEATCIGVAKQVKQLVDDGVQVAIVTGGGNFWRGRTSETIDRVKADQIGMLATVMNCIYVSDISVLQEWRQKYLPRSYAVHLLHYFQR